MELVGAKAVNVPESPLDYALRYAALGWKVFPCKGKHPLIKRWQHEASCDEQRIRAWWRQFPGGNIAVVTGKASGIFAVDIDPRNGGDDSLDKLISQYGAIPDDVTQGTGGGGVHYFYSYPEGGIKSRPGFLPGIDIKSDGGYVILAPSIHPNGGVYGFDSCSDPLEGAILKPPPLWLLTLLVKKTKCTSNNPTTCNQIRPSEVSRVRDAMRYIPFDPYRPWVDVGMALHSTGAGDQAFGLWTEWASQSEKFDLNEHRKKWASFELDGGITLGIIFGIAKQNGWIPPQSERPPLATCPDNIAQTSTKPESVGNNINADHLLKRYVFLNNRNRIYDTTTGNELSREGFDGAYAHEFTDKKASTWFLKNPKTIKVDGLICLFGETGNPVNRTGVVLWNIWRDPCVILPSEATKEDVEPWLELLDYLIHDRDEKEHLMNWFAWLLKFPQVKINHALLLSGKHGIGKDMLINFLRYGLGAANVCEPPAGELKESFTDYLHHSKLVIFQEIQTFEGLNLENKLKPMLASPPDMLRVRLFGRGFYETPNLVQAIFMSNYKDALHISEGDRRYFAIWSAAEPMAADYYKKLAEWQESAGNGLVVRWLLDRDLTGFNPKQPAPLTRFKRDLQRTSKSPLRHQLDDMIAVCEYPFNVDCVRSADASRAMRDKFSVRSVGQVLGETGCYQKTCKRSDEGREEIRLYAVRNIAEWQEKQPLEWLIEYDSRR